MPKEQTPAGTGSAKSKVLWSCISVLIAAASIWAVTAQTKQESLKALGQRLASAKPFWLLMAAAGMLGFILFEGLAVRTACTAFTKRPKVRNSWNWAAADIYFSAITPSATGGQPACALLMMQDGIQGSAATAALVLNLAMYTGAILVIGLVSFILKPGLFWNFSLVSRILIGIGYLAQIGLALFFFLLVRHEALLHSICAFFLKVGAKLRLVKHPQKYMEKLAVVISEYRSCASLMLGRPGLLFKVFLYNLLQRASQIMVTVFVFLALGLSGGTGLDIWALQSYTVLGANYVPIPGGMGVTDFLMLDGFGSILSADAAANLELISRSFSFYLCIVLCGGALVLRWLLRKNQKERNPK